MLTAVETCITTILEGGQEYELLGRRYKRADLAELRAWRNELKAQLSAESGGSTRNLGRVSRAS